MKDLFRHPESKCPKCGHLLNAAGSLDNQPRVPVEGDISVCIECSSVLIFRANLSLDLATKEVVKSFAHKTRMEIKEIKRRIKFVGRLH